ncbi:MAG: S-methyl-5-thioribose kinase [Bacillota bacterium]|nr:S-methyl-5-thioribose kinase [Bacillota bacterium]
MGTTHLAYEPLTESSAAAFASQLGIFEEGAILASNEIGDGNLNLVFRITDKQTGKSIILKQALPYAKVVGESWPLTLQRAKIESEALKIFGKMCPDLVPAVYFSDEQMAITAMEDLSSLSIARTGFIQGKTYPLLSSHLGQYLAKTLFYTSDYGLGTDKKRLLVKEFTNPELCKITEDLIFTDPFFDSATNSFEEELRSEVKKIWSDEELKFHASLLKKSFLTETEALLHGDLHTGSIFASENETKVIDPEFAFYGPAGFDIGQVFANLAFQVIVNEKDRDTFLGHIGTTWTTFVAEFTTLWKTENKEIHSIGEQLLSFNLQKFFTDALGFAGCEMIRRTIGLAHVADLDTVEDKLRRIETKKQAISIGKMLIKDREEIKTISDFLSVLHEFVG